MRGLERQLRLLCATDLSRRSDWAAQRAVLLSRQLGAELLLLNVVKPARSERTTRRKTVRAHIMLDARARKLVPSGSIPQISVRVGHHQETIGEVAREWNADLIIIGSHRMRFGDGFVGTTAERVIRKARRPVLVVNRDATAPYEHVLLTSDLSDVSVGAARVAHEFGLLEGTMTPVVHALTPTARAMLRISGASEDLILSKLVWASDSGSELQQRDVRSLLDDTVDRKYIDQWAPRLGVSELMRRISDE